MSPSCGTILISVYRRQTKTCLFSEFFVLTRWDISIKALRSEANVIPSDSTSDRSFPGPNTPQITPKQASRVTLVHFHYFKARSGSHPIPINTCFCPSDFCYVTSRRYRMFEWRVTEQRFGILIYGPPVGATRSPNPVFYSGRVVNSVSTVCSWESAR